MVGALVALRVVRGDRVGSLGVDELDVVLRRLLRELGERRRLLLGGEVDAEDGRLGEDRVQRLHLLEDRLQLLRRVDAEAEDVAAAPLARLDHERRAELGVAHAHQLHLQVGYRDVEVLCHVGVPHEPHVGDEEGAEVALVGREVPHARHLVVHLLVRQQDERLVPDDRSSQLEVSVQPARVVRSVHGLHGREEPRRLADEVREDKLEARVVELRHHVQRLRVAAQPAVGRADVDRDHGVVPDREVDPAVSVADPDEP
mmetsp:Transcript_10682/g.25464  ORF Transcript_10682/g.25464 Transcript_10682/m.25464 type:complete len:258 (+) Transcript_10682:194-967(+)